MKDTPCKLEPPKGIRLSETSYLTHNIVVRRTFWKARKPVPYSLFHKFQNRKNFRFDQLFTGKPGKEMTKVANIIWIWVIHHIFV